MGNRFCYIVAKQQLIYFDGSGSLRQVVHTCASVTKQYNLVAASQLGRKQAHRAIHWIPWSRSVKTGVWLRALGNGDQRCSMDRKAREGLYVYVLR